MKKRIILFVLVAISATLRVNAAPHTRFSPHDTLSTQQLLVVLANNWDSSNAILYAFEKVNGNWVPQFSNPVFVGAKGLGLGDGMLPVIINGAPAKKEGDLKAPAGIFKIGAAFGYADAKEATWIKDNYIQAKDTVFCVDDIKSAFYNRIVSADTVKTDWSSFEYMHRKDDFYKWGLFVEHNSPGVVPGHGSCIFIHIGEGENFATEGCTAMIEADMVRLLHWINAAKNPLLVQLPAGSYRQLATLFNLPAVQ